MADFTTFASALKTHYTNFQIENLGYKKHPFIAMVSKWEKFTGNDAKFPIQIGNPQNNSATFATAIAETSSSIYKDWLLTRKKQFGFARIDNELLEATVDKDGAFLKATEEIDNAMKSLFRKRAIQAARGSSGSFARLSSASGTTTTLTLANPEDVAMFEVGMYLESNNTDNATTVNTSTGSEGLITARDTNLGTLTLSAAITGLAASDYIFPRGDAGLSFSGLSDWLPYDNRATLIAASFYGVTRSVDSTRLAGCYVDGSAMSKEEALIDLAAVIGAEGGQPDHCFMNFKDWKNLVKELSTRVRYTKVKAGEKGHIGFSGVEIDGPNGTITCIPDLTIPVGKAYMLQMDTWKLCSLGKLVELFDGDGLRMTRSRTANECELQLNSYCNLVCFAPGWNGVVSFV